MKIEGSKPKIFFTIIQIPLTPPNTILFGSKNKLKATDIAKSPNKS